MAFVYITCKDKKEARKISKFLLEKKLIACANMFPIESSYWWDGKIIDDNEYVVLGKTIAKNYDKIKKEIKKIHSYSIQCICLLKSESNKEYGLWVKKEVR